MKHTMTTISIAACIAGLVFAACGDDDPAETVAEYGARVDQECAGGDPGFDAFLGEHPEPTAADWAGFLPDPLEMITTVTDCIENSDPPEEVQDEIDAVVAAGHVVVDDFEEALAAAEAGDLEATNVALTRMHDVDQPAMQEEIDAAVAQFQE